MTCLNPGSDVSSIIDGDMLLVNVWKMCVIRFLSQSEAFNLKQGHGLDLGVRQNCCDICNCKRGVLQTPCES